MALLAAFGRSDGAAAKGFRTKRVVSDASTPLPATTDTTAIALVSCNGGKLLSCGYIIDGGPSDLLIAMVITVGPNSEVSCGAAL